MIELVLAEDVPKIAKTGDSVILNDNGTFEIKKADKPFESDSSHEDDKLKDKNCCSKVEKEFDPRIEKYLSIDKEKSWALLTKFYNDGHLDSYKVLKEFINKIAICPDVTEKFDKVMEDWMKSGEADVSSIEKIINSCKKEEGNVEKAERSPEQLRQMEEARKRQQQDDDTKIKPIGKTGDILEEVLKNKPDRDTKWVDEMVSRGDLPKQKPGFPKPKKSR